MQRMLRGLAVLWVAGALVACEDNQAAQNWPHHPERVAQVSKNTEDGEWLLHGLSGGEQRHSPLTQINATNVERLGLAFEFDDFTRRGRAARGLQATPLMDDGVLYFTSGWSIAYAVDAKNGEMLWSFDPEVDGHRAGVACCDVVNRGVALMDDTLYLATLDGYLIALDKTTGAQLWKVDTFTDRSISYTITGAPRIAGNLVVIGNGGGEMGVRGYVTAYHADTGKQAWRFFIVPSADTPENADVARAKKTWSANTRWEYGGGGTAWDSMVYDKQNHTIFIGTGNGSPWPAWERNGGEIRDNLYLSSIVALDADTGRVKWHYQTTPGDSWDYTATQHMILADIDWQGAHRSVIMQAPKNGFFYVLDRVSGELLSAEPFVPVNWASHVDKTSGRPVLTDNAVFKDGPKVVWPSNGGAHNWPPMSYSHKTGLVYIPSFELPIRFDTVPDADGYQTHARNTRGTGRFINPKRDAQLLKGKKIPPIQSRVIAWDPQKGAPAWTSGPQMVWLGGMLSTDGDILVTGTATGALNIYDTRNGKKLKSIATGTMITAPPMTYEIDGTQYIAVLASAGGVVMRGYLPGMAPTKYENNERLLVFKLDGGAVKLPPAYAAPEVQPIATGLPEDSAIIERGKFVYGRFCSSCHAAGMKAVALAPSLWNMSPETHDMFDDIVLGGAYEYGGMPNFRATLSKQDMIALRAYFVADRKAGEQKNRARAIH